MSRPIPEGIHGPGEFMEAACSLYMSLLIKGGADVTKADLAAWKLRWFQQANAAHEAAKLDARPKGTSLQRRGRWLTQWMADNVLPEAAHNLFCHSHGVYGRRFRQALDAQPALKLILTSAPDGLLFALAKATETYVRPEAGREGLIEDLMLFPYWLAVEWRQWIFEALSAQSEYDTEKTAAIASLQVDIQRLLADKR